MNIGIVAEGETDHLVLKNSRSGGDTGNAEVGLTAVHPDFEGEQI